MADEPKVLTKEQLARGRSLMNAEVPHDIREMRRRAQELIDWFTTHADALLDMAERAEKAEARVKELEQRLRAEAPVYCKHCPFSRAMHYEQDGELITPTCPGFEAFDS